MNMPRNDDLQNILSHMAPEDASELQELFAETPRIYEGFLGILRRKKEALAMNDLALLADIVRDEEKLLSEIE